jgi:hypothetical protein
MEALKRVTSMQIKEFGEYGGKEKGVLQVVRVFKASKDESFQTGVNPSIEVSTTFTGNSSLVLLNDSLRNLLLLDIAVDCTVLDPATLDELFLGHTGPQHGKIASL